MKELGAGQFIGLLDKNGRQIHIGDVLSFDAEEWGGEHTFKIELIGGVISGSGCPSDWSNFCEIVFGCHE